jgi:hypothetical protein
MEQGTLPNLYAVEPLVNALQVMAMAVSQSTSDSGKVEFGQDVWARGLAALAEISEFKKAASLLRQIAIRRAVDEAMREAGEWTATTGATRVVADTLAGALNRMCSRQIGVSLDSLVRMTVIRSDGAHLYLLDSDDGGSGSARRISDEVRRTGGIEFMRRLLDERRCRASQVDRVVERALLSDTRPELLAAMAMSDEFPAAWFDGVSDSGVGRSKRRLARLVETPPLAAFNIYLAKLVNDLGRMAGFKAPESWVLWQVARTPALDVRAEVLRQVFLKGEGGLNELSARVGDALPLCESGCPECVGADQWRETGYADRAILDSMASAKVQS